MQAHEGSISYQRSNRATVMLAIWTLAWTASLALAVFGSSNFWKDNEILSWAAIGLNVAIGVGLLVAHARFLRAIDELQRKINLDALAMTLGIGFVVGFAYVAARSADLVSADVSIALFSTALAVICMAAILIGNLRYR